MKLETAHPSCMDYSDQLARRARNSPWQCIDCKTCSLCSDSGDPDAMLFCDACDKGYHMNCHRPVIHDKPTGKWVCHQCVVELGLMEEAMDTSRPSHNNHVTNGTGFMPTPSASPVPDTGFHRDAKQNGSFGGSISNGPIVTLPRLADTLPVNVPDASEWSIEDVAQYFKNVGFVEQAEVFREQEIDGRSLLLLKRNDVLTGLSLKLGPALKIYTHVQRLQTRGHSLH